MREEHIGEATDFVLQLAIGDRLRFVGAVAFPDDGDCVGLRRGVTIDAIVSDVQFAIFEPLDRDIVRVEGRVLHLGEGFGPVQPKRLLTPEALGVFDGAAIHRLVFGIIDRAAAAVSAGTGNSVSDIVVLPFMWRARSCRRRCPPLIFNLGDQRTSAARARSHTVAALCENPGHRPCVRCDTFVSRRKQSLAERNPRKRSITPFYHGFR